MNYEDLVPFCDVRCYVDGSNEDIINFSSFGGNEETFIYENQVGVESVDITLAGGGTKVSLKIPLSENIIDRVSEEDSPLYKALFLNNSWSLEYGWGGGRGYSSSSKISKMKVATFGIDYDPALRSYMLSIDLIPSYKLTLGNITLDLCSSTIIKYNTLTHGTTGEAKISKNNKNFSLSTIISKLLHDCNNIVRLNQANANISPEDFKQPRATMVYAGSLDEPEFVMQKRVQGWIDIYDPIRNKWTSVEDSKEVRESSKFYSHFLPEEVANANIEDIPKPDRDILITLIGKTEDECRFLKDAIVGEAIPAEAQKVFMKMFDRQYSQSTSVYRFINNLLEASGFMLYHSPGILDPKTGEMAWLILPLAFNSVPEKYITMEFRGLENPIEVPEEKRSIQTVIGDQGGGFDLHSRNNVILSLQANTDSSQPSYASASAQETLARSGNNVSDESAKMREHLNSMYSLLVKQSKTVSVTTIGIPNIRPFTTIPMNIAGKLFSGTYKVMQVTHNIQDSFTTSMELVQLKDGPPVEVSDDTPTNVEDRTRWEEINVINFSPGEGDTEPLPGTGTPNPASY